MSSNWDKNQIDEILEKEGAWKNHIKGWVFCMIAVLLQYLIGYALRIKHGEPNISIVIPADGSDFTWTILSQIIAFTICVLLPALIAWRVEKSFDDTK